MKSAAKCLTISAEKPFLPTLAAWLWQTHGQTPETMSRVRVLLPNRRACRALRDAFLNISAGKPLLLPRIQPIGDLENRDLPADILAEIALQDIPPAIAAERRLLLLARLVMQFESMRADAGGITQSIQLARKLAGLIDELALENADVADLPSLVPQEMARHWQQTVEFLAIISRHWPLALQSENVVDPSTRCNLLLGAVAQRWQAEPPDYPVIAAGSTGTHPATARLLSVIARLPSGHVILPGVDTAMQDDEWQALEPTHPQYTLRLLLDRIECRREEVKPLDAASATPCNDALRVVFQPAEATAGWSESRIDMAAHLRHVRFSIFDTEFDEARAVAVALREALETPGKTAALITPDRSLARMVVAEMRRFGVEVNDSGGMPLADTPAAAFLRLTLDMLLSQAAPVQLLAMLRHPFAAAGYDVAECRRLSRRLEKQLLRGVRHAPGMASLIAAAEKYPELEPFLKAIDQQLRTLAPSFLTGKPATLSCLMQEHMAFSEWLASDGTDNGKQRIWAGEAGEQLAGCMAAALPHADILGVIPVSSYGAFFETLLAEEVSRPRYGLHPRLHILSPFESRLLHFDRVILSGLNEGVWPGQPSPDPWMSRPMREAFGLSPPERSIGQAAHDFFHHCHAPDVLLTRARKNGGSPMVASRWLVRLATLFKGLDAQGFAQFSDASFFSGASDRLMKPEKQNPLSQPCPVPPVSIRPDRLSVSAIDLWQRDPYSLYARYMLNLRELDPLDQEPTAADFGTLVHDALKRFVDAWPQALPEHAYEALLACGRSEFAVAMDQPVVACLWWPRFEAMCTWLLEEEKKRRAQGIRVIAEREGVLPFTVNDALFHITARIDRVEIGGDGNAAVIDYKTGTVNSAADIKRGDANQLPIGALIAMDGLLKPNLDARVTVTGMEYWKLSGNAQNCEIKSAGKPDAVSSLIDECRERLQAMVDAYHRPETVFPAKARLAVARYDSYGHLARRQEWGEE